VEATGSPEGLRRALELVRPEGTVVLKTTVAGDSTLDLAASVVNEIRIVGSRCGPFRPAIEALAMGTVNVLPLVTAVYELDDGPMVIERASFSDNLKVIVKIG
jgi:threonine dehydrogenase-like Zn-dependent dehydrogenase